MSGNLKQIRIALVSIMLFFAASLSAQTVKGTVIDNTGEPVIGASVFEQGVQSNGVATDIDGNFTLTLKGNSKKLKISYIGMKTQIVNVAGKSTVSVKLEDESNSLNDVVVIGYGTVKKKDLTGSVSSISAKDIANVPVSNVSEAMTGKLAGVNITTTEGSPDADVKIRVRGGGSISQDNSPLYIVDGFPVSSISDIAPSEIQTIDVLKDASSTAIYGARGANGVIIITTKSGSEGKTQVNFNASYSWKKVTKFVKTMDPYNYAMYQYEINPTSGEYGNFEDLDIWKSKEGTDYQDELFGRTGHQYQYNVSISGGTKDMKYSVSYARNDENSIMLGSGYTKDNINAKINANLNKWLSMDFNARFANTKINGISGGQDTNAGGATNGIVAQVITYRPVEPINASGDDDDEENQLSNDRTPLQRINATYKKQIRFQQNYNAGLNWKPFKGWTVRSEFGFGWKYYDTYDIQGGDATRSTKVTGAEQGKPVAEFTYDKTKTWRNANTITYDNKKLFGGRDHINVMIGQEWSSEEGQVHAITAGNYLASMLPTEIKANMQAGETLMNKTTIDIPDHLLSFFGRFNYTLADKYLATVTLRADGSSKFAKGHRWGYFPSVALAWRVSDEAFMKNTQNWLSNLKLRLSYGTAGNNRITSGVTTLSYVANGASDKVPFFGEDRASLLKSNGYLSNPNLKWETTITRNIGIDYGFFRGRINGTLDFYWNTTKDLLTKADIPGSSGFTVQYQNFGKTSNKGVELALNAALIAKKNFNLNFNFNVSYNKSKIDQLAGNGIWDTNYTLPNTSTGQNFRIEEGGRLGELWGYKYNGYYTIYDENTNPNGDLVFNGSNWVLREGVNDKSYKLTGGQLAPGGMKVVCDADGTPLKMRLGNTLPTTTGGFGFDGTFNTKGGNIDFNLFFNYSLGNKIVNGTKLANSFFKDTRPRQNLVADFNMGKRYTGIDPVTGDVLVNKSGSTSQDMITKYGGLEGLVARLNEINAGANIYNPVTATRMELTDYCVENGNFLRLQNFTIGYTLPKNWVKAAFLSNVRIYFTAYNLFCITSYSGYDPEVDSSSKKSPLSPGVDYATYPKSRSFVGGINVTF